MKKKLLHLAVVAAVSAAPLAAMADATVYGKFHMSVNSYGGMLSDVDTDNDGINDEPGLTVSSNSSNIGIKGDVDAGGGLKAVYVLEWTVNFDAGGAPAGSRNSFGGLAGGFGMVGMGYHDNPVKLVGRSVDLFGDTVGDTRNLIDEGFSDARLSDVIGYMTNDLGGFKLMVGFVPGMTVPGAASGAGDMEITGLAASGVFTRGPLMVGLGIHSLSADYNDAGVAGTAANFSEAMTRLVASYKVGPATINGLWQSVSSTDEDSAGVKTDYGRSVLGLGFKMGVGSAGTVKAQYYMAGAEDNAPVDDGATQLSVGYDHKLGDKVTVYGMYSQVSNDTAGTYEVAAGGHGDKNKVAMDPTEDTNSAISAGIVYKF